MAGLSDIVTGARVAEDRLVASIPDNWMQGRTAYGGLSAALAVEATNRLIPDLPALQTALIAFVGPLAGTVSVRPQLLRRGRTAAFVQADVEGEGGVGLRATLFFKQATPSEVDHDVRTMPDVPPPEDCKRVDHKMPPEFFGHRLEFRFAMDERTADVPTFLRWVRLRERGIFHPAVELIAIGDALPPAAMSIMPRQGPISSTTWSVNILAEQPGTRDGWWLLRSTSDHTRGGFSSQIMDIWNTDGVQIASGMQGVAIYV